jgi:nicotinamidase-related amidase
MSRNALLIIDPQRSFVDPELHELPVAGAQDDMARLAAFVRGHAESLDDVQVTLDSHHQFQIFHPLYWQGTTGGLPPPFTLITAADIEAGIWLPRRPEHRERALAYVRTLGEGKRFQLTIWPNHCLIGTAGIAVDPGLMAALIHWERRGYAAVGFTAKGSNLYTEHYSAFKAEVADPADPGTQLNTSLVETLRPADRILVAGEALDYCVYHSVRDLADALGPRDAAKIHVLEDCTSPIDPASVERIRREFKSWGVSMLRSTAV